MTLSPTVLKVNVEAVISALTGSETIDELMIIHKSSRGLNASNYSVLEAAIQPVIDAQTPSTDHTDLLLSGVMIGATQALTNTTEVEVVVSTSALVAVPLNAVRCLVTAAGGGGGGHGNDFAPTRAHSGGGSGASVIEYEIGVDGSGTGTLNVVIETGIASENTAGKSHTIGALVVGGGQAGTGGIISNSGIVYEGGGGGVVTFNGIVQVEGLTVINGVSGGNSGAITPNTPSSVGSDQYGFTGGSSGVGGVADGGGGAASWGGDGGDGGGGTSVPLYHGGNGADGAGGGGAYGSAEHANTLGGNGGVPSANVVLRFIIETVV